MRRSVYTIPPDVPFLQALAQGIVEQAGGLTPELTKFTILLPTRRACRDLRDTFLKLSDGKPLLLPRMQPLGDTDQEELDLRLAGFRNADTIPDIPPAVSSLKRLILLSQLIHKRDPALNQQQALKLATSLATLIDQVHTEDLSFSRLKDIVPGTLSEHWQQTLTFLEIVTEFWPDILEQSGEIDPADRRNRLMKTLAQSWRDNPPAYPLIAAGSTGSIPATAHLLDVISSLPTGAVVLPGLDQNLDSESWDALTDTHPQATMRTLLSRMDTKRDQVKVWPSASGNTTSRPWLAREIMRPAETVREWIHLKDKAPDLSEALATVRLIETKTQSEEAQTIAVLMRAILEEPGKRAALVTPDRALARRVCAALKKWNIPVDDSAGTSLAMTPAGHLLECIFACVLENFSPSSFLNFLKHPSVKIFDDTLIGDFEIELCRGPRPINGLESLKQRCTQLKTPRPDLEDVLLQIENLFMPLSALRQNLHDVATYLDAIIKIAEAAGGGDKSIWLQEDGEAASLLMSETVQHAALFSRVDLLSMQGILQQLMLGVPVRHPVLHPRLIILGQLEARMIQTDVMILGSLNEGSWPAEPGHDPWMSRPMRKDFGLPTPERSIGLAAHDFVQSICAPSVFITRSEKVEGTPTVPSRWLQRLHTMLTAAKVKAPVDDTYSSWAKTLQENAGLQQPATRPEPRPPAARRPLTLSATWIERWIRNPYQVYVHKILRLEPLQPLDQDTTAAERGSLVHAILKDFIETYPDHLPPAAHAEFIRIARTHLDNLESDPAQREYWWPRLEQLAGWFIANENEWRRKATPWKQETRGEIEIPISRGTFKLFARADRIDRLRDGSAAIIDYKTGEPPTASSIASGEDAQLPLEGLILRKGGFDPDIRRAGMFSFWKLLGSQGSGKTSELINTDEMIDNAEQGLLKLLELYEDPLTPYIAKPPRNAARMYDNEKTIAHLARTAEWSSEDNDENEATA